ncbi:MAG: divalent-cation tolerance protein CutA [Gammaproteobacteria bacterium]|jgi:periplasmic divalent cation tolerance protein
MSDHHCVVLNTCPDADSAEDIAQTLLDRKLAACVNILPGVKSFFTWKGVSETAEEHVLLIKTCSSTYPAVEQAILELHPYELPEIIAVPIAAGLPGYLTWITQNTTTPTID